jgi:hypothetical protein
VSELESEADGSDEISVLLASSPMSLVSLPSLVSFPTSPDSQPSSLTFVGSFDEPGSLSVTQTPSPRKRILSISKSPNFLHLVYFKG